SQMRHGPSPGEHVLSLLAECLSHLVSKVAAEIGGEEPQQLSKKPIGSRHERGPYVLKSGLRRASASVCSSRAASARSTSAPNRVSSYRRRRASPTTLVSLIKPSANSRLMMP